MHLCHIPSRVFCFVFCPVHLPLLLVPLPVDCLLGFWRPMPHCYPIIPCIKCLQVIISVLSSVVWLCVCVSHLYITLCFCVCLFNKMCQTARGSASFEAYSQIFVDKRCCLFCNFWKSTLTITCMDLNNYAKITFRNFHATDKRSFILFVLYMHKCISQVTLGTA